MPFTEIAGAVQALSAAVPTVGSVIEIPSRWFHAALAEKQDPLRRFLFAFFGLEVLVNKVARNWKVQERVGKELSNELAGVPIDVLMWPVKGDDGASSRNLMFRFACLATLLSRSTATQDVAEFRSLAQVRNKVAHGELSDIGDIDSLPAWPCIELLRRYLSLVATAATVRLP